MGFLERAIRKGIREGVGKAVGDAISKAIEPTATNFANKAAEHLDNATNNAAAQQRTPSGFENAFSNLERAAQNYTTEMSKNLKICPVCGKGATAEKSFCPACGEKLPEKTVAEGAVCNSCGKQNPVGTKFCTDCGAKLPSAIEEETAQKIKDDNVIAQWSNLLDVYPVWNCGGKNYNIEDYGDHIMFSADFENNDYAARNAVEQYRQLLLQNGFRQAGQYPAPEHLYKKIDGVCYHVDTEHCFEGDSDCPCIYFLTGEPTGGFDYVKPEPKKPLGFKDLFNF